MDSRPFLIAGGGIAGLAASLGLARIGCGSRVFEQMAGFEAVGAGLQMPPNGVRALQRLGAWEAIAPHCVAPAEIHVRDGRSGKLLQRIVLGKNFEQRFGAPYRVLHRADLMDGLLATAGGSASIELLTSRQVVSAENTGDGARLVLADGAAEGAAVIAADGIGSVIRQQVAADGEPVYRGQAIFRALIPFAEVPAGIVADSVTLWLYPGGHAVHYPVSNWRQFNMVVAIDSRWESAGWSEPGESAELLGVFDHAAPALAELLITPKSWLKWAGADRRPTAAWTEGHIALIGDAAHASLPYLAQGAVMALEDASVLAREIIAGTSIPASLTRYAELRHRRTAAIQNASRRLAGIYHARGIHRLSRNLALSLMPPDSFLGRMKWIYDWDVMQ